MLDGLSERFVPDYRKTHFKNRNRFLLDELRRRREVHHVSLRKLRRDEELLKRRKIHTTGDLLLQDLEIRIENSISTSFSNPGLVPQLQSIKKTLLDGVDDNISLKMDVQSSLLAALTTLATLLSPTASETVPPIDELISLGLVPILMLYMLSPVYEHQYQLLWALANIASGTETHTKLLIENHRIIPLLLNLIGSTTSISLKEELLLCLGNLCIDNLNGEEVRNTIIIGGGLVKLIEILIVDDDFNVAGSSLGLKRKASWVFMQLCKTDQYGRLPSSNWNVLRYIIPQLYYILEHENQDHMVLKDLLKLVEFLTNELLTNNRSNTMMDFKIHSLLIHRFLLRKKYSSELKILCLKIIKNLITATSQKATVLLVQEGLLKTVFHIFTLLSNSVDLKKELCSLIGIVNQCSAEMIQMVFDTSLIPHLIHCLKNGTFSLRAEACNALCNAIQFSLPTLLEAVITTNHIDMHPVHISKQSPRIIPFLVLQGILSPLCEMLLVLHLDLQLRILKSLERILATGEFLAQCGEMPTNEYVMFLVECGGKEVLESLIGNAMNDDDSEMNMELVAEVEALLRKYVVLGDLLLSTNSSDMSGSDYQFQFHTFNSMEEDKDGLADVDTTMLPSIGDDGFFKFG